MFFWVMVGVALAGMAAALLYRPMRRFYREVTEERAHELFRLQREMLEAKFLELGRSKGMADGVAWSDCEFDGDSQFARHLKSGQLVAFVEVTVHFESEAASIDSETIGANRQATAVFQYHHGQWGTNGRALFDMTPAEALEHFQGEYQPLAFAESA